MKKFYLVLKIVLTSLMILSMTAKYVKAEDGVLLDELDSEEYYETLEENPVVVKSTYQGYEGSISSTYTEYFKGILAKHPLKDYVIARTGQYEYICAVGNISYNNSQFTGSGNIDVCRIYTYTYNSNFSIEFLKDNNFILYPNNNMIYSNLGDYPTLDYGANVGLQKGGLYVQVVVILCVVLYGFYKVGTNRRIRIG